MSNQDEAIIAVEEHADWGVDPPNVQMPARATNEEQKKKQVAAAMNRDSYSAAKPAREHYREQITIYQDSLGSDDDTDDAEDIESVIIVESDSIAVNPGRSAPKHQQATKPIVEESLPQQIADAIKSESNKALWPVNEVVREDQAARDILDDDIKLSIEVDDEEPKEEELPVSVQDYS